VLKLSLAKTVLRGQYSLPRTNYPDWYETGPKNEFSVPVGMLRVDEFKE